MLEEEEKQEGSKFVQMIQVIKTVDKMIGMKIITPQTTESGKIVRRVYLEKDIKFKMNFICA